MHRCWRDNPVLTTVSATALPIEKVEFPIITVCGLGNIKETLDIAYRRQLLQYLSEKGLNHTDDDHEFIREKYPGAILSPVEMVSAMTSNNPTQKVRAQIVVSGGIDTKEYRVYSSNLTTANIEQEKEEEEEDRCGNLLHDPISDMCYDFSVRETEHADAFSECWSKLGSMLYVFSDEQLKGLIKLIEEGPLKILKRGHPIWVDITRSLDGSFTLYDGSVLTNTTFVHLNLTHTDVSDPRQRCFVMRYSVIGKLFIGRQTYCRNLHASLCYTFLHRHPDNITASGQGKGHPFGAQWNSTNSNRTNLLDRLLNPQSRFPLNREVSLKKKYYYKAFRSLDLKATYSSLFELLWYSQLPCFDVDGFSEYPNQRSLLKQCRWKGIDIPCSAIFNTVPTDRGMCCTFNMRAADDIFAKSVYQEMVSRLQNEDNNNSFSYSGKPEWYAQASEPTAQQGVHRGLSLTLDAHTDLIGSSTVSEDYQGFIAIVNGRNSYPLARQKSIRIRPGHDNLVSMTATDVRTSDDFRFMNVLDRQCYFPEDKNLTMHNKYSQASCVLECQIVYAMDQMTQVGEEPCIPWYLPTLPDTVDTKMCNPWSAVTFREQIELMPNDKCMHCLPDCQYTTYGRSVTAVPFRRCDNKNLGISRLCNLDDSTLPEPAIFGRQVLREFEGLSELPDYVRDFKTSERFYSSSSRSEEEVFAKSNERPEDVSYDAYKEDIAVVHFYFESATIFQYLQQPRLTWIDFVSQVGGLLGLCVGFSICSGVEILYWLGFRIWCNVLRNNPE